MLSKTVLIVLVAFTAQVLCHQYPKFEESRNRAIAKCRDKVDEISIHVKQIQQETENYIRHVKDDVVAKNKALLAKIDTSLPDRDGFAKYIRGIESTFIKMLEHAVSSDGIQCDKNVGSSSTLVFHTCKLNVVERVNNAEVIFITSRGYAGDIPDAEALEESEKVAKKVYQENVAYINKINIDDIKLQANNCGKIAKAIIETTADQVEAEVQQRFDNIMKPF